MKRAVAGIAVLAIVASGCSVAASSPSAVPNVAAPTPIIIYVTPPPAATPEATLAPTPEPTLEPTPTPEPTAKPTPTPKPKPIAYQALSSRSWAQLLKAPDNYTGDHYKLWACISQFDAATGLDSFRGQASYRNEDYWYTDGQNAYFNGDADRLAEFVTDDLVFMNVDVVGSFSYDTQAGGNTTVPLFMVNVISRKGSC
jgi:hypothetical protein